MRLLPLLVMELPGVCCLTSPPLGFPWFPCRFYVVFPWFSLVLEPQENSGKTKRKLQENYRKTPEKPGKTREGENHKPPVVFL